MASLVYMYRLYLEREPT